MSPRPALIIGNLDGAHAGHRHLVEAARAAVGPAGRVRVLSFDPHPLRVLKPEVAPPRLSSFQQRAAWLTEAGADEVLPLTPDATFLDQTPEAFLEGIVREHDPSHIVEGPDFHFGRGRSGSIETLRRQAKSLGYETVIIDAVEKPLADQTVVRVSSTLIRWLLERGRVRDAGALLGRPYEMCCPVERGDGRGRTLGVPSANLDHRDWTLPADGIYVGRALRPDGTGHPAAISVGTKPTFGAHPRTCEAHLVGFDGPLDEYGWSIRLQFGDWLRDQIAFESAADLVDQIARDVARVREMALEPIPSGG